jgi:hypothetical protein
MNRGDDTGDIRRWLMENTDGLEPTEAEKARTEIEKHIADVVRDRLAKVPANPAEQGAYYEALHDLVADLPPETREDLDLLISADERMAKDAVRMRERLVRLKCWSLDLWLGLATKGISRQGKERIRDEISAHYEDALHEGLQQGLTKIEAHIAAMESLGDARKAARGFRRNYLTEKETKWAEDEKRPQWGSLWGILALTSFCWLGLGFSAFGNSLAMLSLVAFAAYLILFVLVMLRVVPRAARSGQFRTCYRLRCLVMLPYPLFWVLAAQGMGQLSIRRGLLVDVLSLLCLIVLFGLVDARIARKIHGALPKRRP